MLGAVILLSACRGGSDDVASSTTTTEPAASATSTTSPEFAGEPDSEFCSLVNSADERPVRDPFEAGLDPPEVRVRFRALQLRFEELAAVAPPELGDDLDALVDSLDELDVVLADAGYDFGRLAGTDADVSAFDDPRFVDTATRLASYRAQVCQG